MKKVGIKIKIDVKKIEKARLYQGKNAIYLDATCFINLDEQDQYGNHGMITQDVSKTEKEDGVKGPILGNVKIFWKDENNQRQQPQQQQQPQPDDDIPW